MSAPHTDLERQKRRHRGPLIGIIVVLLFVSAIFAYFVLYEFGQSDPATSDAPTDTPVSTTTPEVITPAPQADPSEPSGAGTDGNN